MRLIRKGPEPPLLLAYRKTRGARYDGLPGDAKTELRSALVRDQLGLCCFCMQRVEPAVAPVLKVKIAHLIPQKVDGLRDLEWSNLLAACPGNEGASLARQHCDTRQGNSVLHVSPCEPEHIATLSYSGRGEIQSSREDLQKDLDETLNLNDVGLCARRRDAVTSMARALRKRDKGQFTTPNLQRALGECSTPDARGNLPPFAGALEWWLRRRLGPRAG